MKTKQEHMAWCKKRAKEYTEVGDGQQAMTSMLSDLRKHPETESVVQLAFGIIMTINSNNMSDVNRFIDGFN